MKKEITVSITLLIFLISCVSCSSTKTINPATTDPPHGRASILGVQKKTGEYIEFSKDRPSGIRNGSIHGFIGEKYLELNRGDFEYGKSDLHDGYKKAFSIKIKDGRMFNVLAVEEKEKSVRFLIRLNYPEAVSIPVSEAELIWIKRSDPVKSFLAAVGIVAGVFAVALAIIAATKESCPFIYSFDGREFVFDAEPYGGATCPGMQRTEWCALEHLHPVAGRYKIMVTNEVDETQCTDELKLIVVDHPRGTRVAADENGGIHTFAHVIPPGRAVDREGRLLTDRVAAADRVFWATPEDALDPGQRADLKDELTFEFAKPCDAQTVKLLFNGCNTLWASQMLKRFLELRGSEVGAYYRLLNERGLFYQALMEWNRDAELYLLRLQVETSSGWQTKGTLVGGGPFVSESKAYVLDIRDVPGDMLRIRLTPPAGFWMINHVAVDFSPDAPVQVTELSAIRGDDSRGQDAPGLLNQTDGRYLRMPDTGDHAVLEFNTPPAKKGSERSVLVKASGYYDIHLHAQGEPQRALLSRIREEPGFAIEYSLREYLKWRQEKASESQEVE